ncbi:MAG: AAA family ATPase [Asticcacaulis sp.]
MLTRLLIADVVLVDRLELELRPGLSVLTGETGAGKSILLDSLGLATGARSDAGLIRAGAAQASVTAEFEVTSTHPVSSKTRGWRANRARPCCCAAWSIATAVPRPLSTTSRSAWRAEGAGRQPAGSPWPA